MTHDIYFHLYWAVKAFLGSFGVCLPGVPARMLVAA
jgi:hypothetical protein